jgi:hypothetical protein
MACAGAADTAFIGNNSDLDLAIVVVPFLVGLALRSWWACVLLPSASIAAFLTGESWHLQGIGLTAYWQATRCGLDFDVTKPCSVAEVPTIAVILSVFVVAPPTFVGVVLGRLGGWLWSFRTHR